jgi:hypothetical protein
MKNEKPIETKQETLQEVAEKILANNIDGLRDALKDDDLFFFYKGVIVCYGEAMAEWQKGRGYNDEEVLNLLIECSKWQLPQTGQDLSKIKQWFDKIKKK